MKYIFLKDFPEVNYKKGDILECKKDEKIIFNGIFGQDIFPAMKRDGIIEEVEEKTEEPCYCSEDDFGHQKEASCEGEIAPVEEKKCHDDCKTNCHGECMADKEYKRLFKEIEKLKHSPMSTDTQSSIKITLETVRDNGNAPVDEEEKFKCNYDEPHRCSFLHCNHCGKCEEEKPTLQSLIDDCKFNYVNNNITEANFPDWQPSGKKLEVLPIDKLMNDEELLKMIDEKGCQPANIGDLLVYIKDKTLDKCILALDSRWTNSGGRVLVPHACVLGAFRDFCLSDFRHQLASHYGILVYKKNEEKSNTKSTTDEDVKVYKGYPDFSKFKPATELVCDTKESIYIFDKTEKVQIDKEKLKKVLRPLLEGIPNEFFPSKYERIELENLIDEL